MGSSTIGKGDTSRPGVRGDKKGGGYGVYTEKTYSNIGSKGNNLAGYTSIAPKPTVMSGKGSLPPRLPKPTGAETVAGIKTKNIPRSYVPSRIKQIFDPTPFATPVVKMPAAKTKKPAPQVVSNVTREKLSPTKTAPARMAVNPRTGNTTGFTTGKTTGTSVSKSGVATKTYQSAGDRMKANAMNRTNQPAGPMGGGGGRMGGGGASRTSSGGGNLGGARGRISEPGGSKR